MRKFQVLKRKHQDYVQSRFTRLFLSAIPITDCGLLKGEREFQTELFYLLAKTQFCSVYHFSNDFVFQILFDGGDTSRRLRKRRAKLTISSLLQEKNIHWLCCRRAQYSLIADYFSMIDMLRPVICELHGIIIFCQ